MIDKVEVTAKLVNRLKVYSGDITCFDDIRKIAAELNEQINSEKCQATDKPPFELLKIEKPYLIQTDLNILSGYFKETVTRKVSVESLITYEGRKYSVPPKYIGKYVDKKKVKYIIPESYKRFEKQPGSNNNLLCGKSGDPLCIRKVKCMWVDGTDTLMPIAVSKGLTAETY